MGKVLKLNALTSIPVFGSFPLSPPVSAQSVPKSVPKTFTDSRIAALRKQAMTEGKDIRENDVGTRGLYLQTRYTGKQTWILRWKVDGIAKKITLGEYPKMTLAEARIKTAEAIDAVKMGDNPHEAKQRANTQFSTFLNSFAERYRVKKTASTIETFERNLSLLKKKLGSLPVEQVLTGRIASALKGLSEGNVKRCLYVIKGALREAVVQNSVKWNVARELKTSDIHSAPLRRIPRLHVSVKELPQVITAVAGRSPVSADCLCIVALCGTRIYETVTMEWSHIDWTEKLWTIPAANRKGKLESKQSLTIPLSTEAISTLRETFTKRRLSERWVFPGHKEQHITQRAVLASLQVFAPGMSVHGLRKLFSTTTNESGLFEPHVIEAALGHVTPGVAGVYNKAAYLTQRTKLMQWWADHLNLLAAKNA